VVRVSIEVESGAGRFGLIVRAESIVQALRIAVALYPDAEARVAFPIEPEGFFVEDPAVTPGPVWPEMAQEGVAPG
jgi:hypothetical protein